ncbi:MAG: hypothetical protein FIA92_17755 [Chloroflexi bacterium]|nr:hypothetical protein [Chloroflexota bacterium]
MARGALVLAFGLAAGCATPAPPAPSPPNLEVVGRVIEAQARGEGRRYLLDDGRVIEISPPTRILFEGGLGQPVVLGRDAAGEFVLVFATQAGLPADCHLPGLGPEGIERGPYIEIHGILWRKASRFSSAETPPLGSAYSGSTRFCFDDRAEVAYTVPR